MERRERSELKKMVEKEKGRKYFRTHEDLAIYQLAFETAIPTPPTLPNPMYTSVFPIGKAIYILRQCRAILQPTDAINYLRQQLTTYRLLSLYQQYFPCEFASSTASPYPATDSDQSANPYTEKEFEFLSLVARNLFPLPYLEWLDDYSFIEPWEILITPMGLGWLDEEGVGWDALMPGFRVLLPLSQLGREELDSYAEMEQWYEEEWEFPLSLDEIAQPESVNAKKLRRLCHQAGKPINFLPLALNLLDFSTGNLWLDEFGGQLNSCDATIHEWSQDSVRYLTRECHKAKYILAAIDGFIEWLEADITPRFLQIVQLWNHSSTTHNPYPLKH